ncbi:O-antigen ligase family protein [Salinibacterium sp. SYSU T00001]|uniref:O-antigen ligase family protein n=1 Tax=Homoserinimonas sedimenticola TaxID=2986805 RepID=UPI0022354897|nr:O-antigen ligase family protein [Salinibacterium sedimenticola]MCW4385011.1 O-antigen ligase family protein [Salinibacterium sedimenticola]
MPRTAAPVSRGMRAYATLVLFTLLAGDAWRNSISWLGWGILIGALALAGITMLVRRRRDIRPDSMPYPLLVFLGLATASIAWSAYPQWTALGALAQWVTTAIAGLLALTLDWREMLRVLSRAVRLILALSLLFELVVALFVRQPVFPFFTGWTVDEVPIMYAWSRADLFTGDPIQGIVGNSSTLGFIALLGLIVFAIEWFVGRGADATAADPRGADLHGADMLTPRHRRLHVAGWFAVAALVVVLTASATITVAIVAVLAVTGLVQLMHRVPVGPPRLAAGSAALLVAAGLVTVAILMRESLLGLLGKSADLTGRLDNWRIVADLAAERPVAGWGWVSYWIPWVEPFDGLVIRNDTEQLHAHNAWLDAYLQLGVIGVVVLAALVLSVATRAWFIALDGASASRPADRALAMLPLLLVTVLVVQSLVESRLLLEYGWFLLAYLAFATRRVAAGPDGPVRWMPQSRVS